MLTALGKVCAPDHEECMRGFQTKQQRSKKQHQSWCPHPNRTPSIPEFPDVDVVWGELDTIDVGLSKSTVRAFRGVLGNLGEASGTDQYMLVCFEGALSGWSSR